jgi:ectoine hydroxylase-related dioxygenase (phytanoyl-CoA dioxygenase family)
VVPRSQRAQLPRMAAVAAAFAHDVPEVLAFDEENGWLLVADHAGEAADAEAATLAAMASAYAGLQLESMADPSLLGMMQPVVLNTALPALFDFLERPASKAGAAHFLGATMAAQYANQLRAAEPLLAAQLARSAALPQALCHGDLNTGNAAVRDDGSVVFIDWDELAVGPLGMCLRGLSSGCAMPSVVLRRMAAGEALPDAPVTEWLQAFVAECVAHGVAQAPLLQGLPGALCLGQVRFITSYGRYPGEHQARATRRALTVALDDLLDLCDWLASQNGPQALALADAYETDAQWARSQRLLQHILTFQPNRVDLSLRCATLALRQGELAGAEEACQEALAQQPLNTVAHLLLASVQAHRLELVAALARVNAVLAREPGHAQAAAQRERLQKMVAIQAAADEPGQLPCVALSAAERQRGELDGDTQALVVALFKRYGVVQVDNVYSPAYVERLRAAFEHQQARSLADSTHSGMLEVGDRRYMHTVTLDDELGAPELVASSVFMPVMRAILGPQCILGAYTAVSSHPGSADQEIHKDHSALFEERDWQFETPTFAAQVIVPLLGLNEVTGATHIFKGSQRMTLNRSARDMQGCDPVVPLGSCVLLDYSVIHFGRGNRSDQIRTILNLVYQRPWFRDCRNYSLQPPLRFAPNFMAQASDVVKPLVAWWELEQRTAAMG